MSARFAGSQRLGDRRRRRLAVEADEVTDGAVRTTALPASAGNVRTIDAAHANDASRKAAPSSTTPVSRLIPFEWWKYLIAAIGLMAISGGLLVAGFKAAELTPVLGPGFKRLFAFPDAPAARWFSGLLLFVAAELALFIWWARSQSQNDFDGRYWLWIRIACVWLLFSGCVATGAHAALRETALHFRPDLSARMLLLGWLAPTILLGVSVIAALTREMRACPWSRGLLILAGAAHLCAAGFSLEVETFVSSEVRLLLIHGALLAGHIGLFLSMWWHARHVVHCTADPAIRPESRWRIPRPHFGLLHFRLPRFGRKQPLDAVPREEATRGTVRRKRPAKVAAVEPHARAEQDSAESLAQTSPQPEAGSKSQFRIDARHENTMGNLERAPVNPVKEAPADRTSTGKIVVDNSSRERDAAPVQPQARTSPVPVQTPPDRDEFETDEDESEDRQSKPDMRGMSKKQRRRLMQELRDRERAAGR